MLTPVRLALGVFLLVTLGQAAEPPIGKSGALDSARPRVIVSSDIGGTDPDDVQSLVHLLLYADAIDLEGLISSPYGPGRKQHILEVIDLYERDYPQLVRRSPRYPAPQALRQLTQQGETASAPYAGFRRPTDGSRWIVERARASDPRPLNVLVWGGIEDLAQALHDAPDILPKLRVYFIGGPNKKWSPDAYQYIETHHPALWIIEANATYRGWFEGGDQSGEWSNTTFVERHIAEHGALGRYFATTLRGTLKMGDTPSLTRLLRGSPDDPSASSWGGRFVRAWSRPSVVVNRLTKTEDRVELFAIVELALPIGADAPASPEAQLVIENQTLPGYVDGHGSMHFRFSPREPKAYSYQVRSNASGLDGVSGAITAVLPSPEVARTPATHLPHWWTDDPSPAVSEGRIHGARTVSYWRRDALADFAARLNRLLGQD